MPKKGEVMKRIVISGLVASALSASLYGQELYITPTIGKVIHESSELEKEKIFGVRIGMPYEHEIGIDTLEFAYDRQNSVGYNNSLESTSINRLSFNALKHYNHFGDLTPYGLAGAGCEHIKNDSKDTDNSLFVNAGVGIKYKLQNNMSLMTDIRHLIRLDEFDNHTIWNVGLVIPVGGVAQKEAPRENTIAIAPQKEEPKIVEEPKIIEEPKPEPIVEKIIEPIEPVVVIEKKDTDNDGVEDGIDKCPTSNAGAAVDPNGCCLDSDNDGVKDFADKCPTSHAGAAVDPNGCCLDGDNDGVKDFADKCPNTPKGFSVDANGCEISFKLQINFDTNKADIKSQYDGDIAQFVAFMKAFPSYKATIEGHTDNRGNATLNKELSQKRADALRGRFIADGIDGGRLSAIGYGAEKPIATNDTAEGQDANRRIEINLSK